MPDDIRDYPNDLVSSEETPAPNGSDHPKWPSGANRGITKVRYTHDALIDFIIADPTISQNALGAHFGYSASWVSQIIASDAFQVRLAERKDSLVDPTIRATVEEKFKAMVLRSMEILQEKLNRPSEDVPDQLALRTLELSARAAGYGARIETAPTVQVNVNNHLEVLGDNLTQLLRRRKAAIDMIPPSAADPQDSHTVSVSVGPPS